MFPRTLPKVRLRLKEGLETERLFEALTGVDFTGAKGDVVAVLRGTTQENSRAFTEIRSRLEASRAGRVVRITVAAAEAAAVADFGPFAVIESLALQDRFVVSLKTKQRAARYVLSRAGKVLSKKESSSDILDVYV